MINTNQKYNVEYLCSYDEENCKFIIKEINMFSPSRELLSLNVYRRQDADMIEEVIERAHSQGVVIDYGDKTIPCSDVVFKESSNTLRLKNFFSGDTFGSEYDVASTHMAVELHDLDNLYSLSFIDRTIHPIKKVSSKFNINILNREINLISKAIKERNIDEDSKDLSFHLSEEEINMLRDEIKNKIIGVPCINSIIYVYTFKSLKINKTREEYRKDRLINTSSNSIILSEDLSKLKKNSQKRKKKKKKEIEKKSVKLKNAYDNLYKESPFKDKELDYLWRDLVDLSKGINEESSELLRKVLEDEEEKNNNNSFFRN